MVVSIYKTVIYACLRIAVEIHIHRTSCGISQVVIYLSLSALMVGVGGRHWLWWEQKREGTSPGLLEASRQVDSPATSKPENIQAGKWTGRARRQVGKWTAIFKASRQVDSKLWGKWRVRPLFRCRRIFSFSGAKPGKLHYFCVAEYLRLPKFSLTNWYVFRENAKFSPKLCCVGFYG